MTVIGMVTLLVMVTSLGMVTVLGMLTIKEYVLLHCMTLHDLILCFYCQKNLFIS